MSWNIWDIVVFFYPASPGSFYPCDAEFCYAFQIRFYTLLSDDNSRNGKNPFYTLYVYLFKRVSIRSIIVSKCSTIVYKGIQWLQAAFKCSTIECELLKKRFQLLHAFCYPTVFFG